MGGLGVKVQHFPLTLLVVLTTLTLPCERDPDCWVFPGALNLGLHPNICRKVHVNLLVKLVPQSDWSANGILVI